MKKDIILITAILMIFLFSLSLVSGIDCEVWDCSDSKLYGFADFSNPIYNNSDVENGNPITMGGYSMSGTVSYSDSQYNVTPLSIAIPANYETGYLATPWTTIAEGNNTNASCIDIYFPDKADGEKAGHVIWNSGLSYRFPADDAANCPNAGYLCYLDGAAFITTDMTVPVGKWFTACVYFDLENSRHILYLDNSTDNFSYYPNPANWGDKFNGETSTIQINGYVRDADFYVDNFRNFNYTYISQMGVEISEEEPEPELSDLSFPKFFNDDNMDSTTIYGALGFIIAIIFVAGFLMLGVYTTLPIFYISCGMSAFFLGMFVFITLSAVLGTCLSLFGLGVMVVYVSLMYS